MTLGLATVCILAAWATLTTALSGEMSPAPGDPAWFGIVPFVIGGGAALLGLWALCTVPAQLMNRFEIDSAGIHWAKLDMTWDQVQAVRILVLRTTKPVAVAPVPRPARSSARISLEVTLRDPEALEASLPHLRSRRIPGSETEGYTHHFPLGPGPVFAGSDASLFAPEVQSVLAAVAPAVYRGVSIRQTATTWTRGSATDSPDSSAAGKG